MARKVSKSLQAKRDFVAGVWEKVCPQGVSIDPLEYPLIDGMGAPMVVKEHASRVLYWDAREGAYYDRKTDLYLWSV